MNKTFELRSYTKAELGMLYFPYASKRNASRALVKLINNHPHLPLKLSETSITATCKVLTPAQVNIIVNILGTPAL